MIKSRSAETRTDICRQTIRPQYGVQEIHVYARPEDDQEGVWLRLMSPGIYSTSYLTVPQAQALVAALGDAMRAKTEAA